MKEWLETISSDLFRSNSLQPEKKLCSAMIILCCLKLFQNRSFFNDINEEFQLNILRMAALSLSGEKEIQFLSGMMQEEKSRSIDVYVFKARIFCDLDFYACVCCVQAACG